MNNYFLTVGYKDNIVKERKRKLEWLAEGKGIREKVEGGFKFYDQNLARHYLSNGIYDINFQQLFFNSGMMWHYINEKYNVKNGKYWFPLPQLCYIVISDNLELLQLINQADRINLNNPNNWQYFAKMYLEIANSDWEGLSNTYEAFINIYENYPDGFSEKHIYKDLFFAFIKKDKDQLEKCLNLLESTKLRSIRQKEVTVEKYLSIYTIALAKLAWMHGMEVEIDSDYVPKELLPFSPLEEYTIPYKFLRDFYREQGVDWRYDPVHPELQEWENDPENPDWKKGGFFKKLFS